MAKHIRVGLIFADDLTREGRRILLQSQEDIDVVYEETDGLRAIASLADFALDVVLVDSRIRSIRGADTIARFLRRNIGSDLRIPAFVLTAPFTSDELLLEGVRCGATEVVTEEDSAEDLLEAIREAAKIDHSFDVRGLAGFFAAMGVPHGGNQRWTLRLNGLNIEEQQVLDALSTGADGDTLKDITGLPQTKVRWTLDALQTRLGLSTRSQLALALYEAGQVPA